ncbi:hypothetical protein GeomeDRAFT_2934 [Geobacter metallireducens RCH3]|nr:hypothetical protein [Geobacter metallireducens]EHP84744.1 hypothetical protein GeomeDRAFT_2934 [Geobacter metallireducens RCH3]
MISQSDFPQADRLEKVGEVAIAVSQGNFSDVSIEGVIGLDSGGRQGRYYRLAAEILGLIVTSNNHSELTALGKEFSSLNTSSARNEFLTRCVLDSIVFQRAIAYINSDHPTEAQLRLWFLKFYPGAESTAKRRFSTFINYLNYLVKNKTIVINKDNYILNKYIGAAVKTKTLLCDGISDKEFKSDPKVGKKIKFEVQSQKLDRANQIHWNLVTAKSLFLKNKNLPAFENEIIDLYSKNNKDIVLYEMKSITDTNFVSQIRKALSQLYEYRYVFSEPNACICIVTNAPISKKDKWVIDYLNNDRLIAYEWTEDFKTFECHDGSQKLLSYFSP